MGSRVGLAVATVAPTILIIIIISSVCRIRRRRRGKEEAATATQNVRNDEGEDTQLYYQQKVELDDEQRRHEMEAVEIRYEMEGEDRIHEKGVERRRRESARQELRFCFAHCQKSLSWTSTLLKKWSLSNPLFQPSYSVQLWCIREKGWRGISHSISRAYKDTFKGSL